MTGKGILGKDDSTEKEIKKKPKSRSKKGLVFNDFDGLKDLEGSVPIMMYFYWPEEKNSRNVPVAPYMRCRELERVVFCDDAVVAETGNFHCYKVNVKTLGKRLKKLYKIRGVPMVLFFDCTGKRIARMTTYKTSGASFALLMKKVVRKNKKTREKIEKKEKEK